MRVPLKRVAPVLLIAAFASVSFADNSSKYPLSLNFVETKSSTATTTSTQTQTNCTPVPGTEQVNCNSRQVGGGPHTSLTSTVEASDGNTYEVMCVLGAGGRFLAGASQGMAAQSGAPTHSGCQVQPGTYQARWDKGKFKVLMHNAKGNAKEITFAVLSSHSTVGNALENAGRVEAPPAVSASRSDGQAPSMQKEEDVFFPTNPQISLLLDQAERAFNTWDATNISSGLNSEVVRHNRETVSAARLGIAKLRQNLDWFNSSAFGLALLIALDDSARDATTCVVNAMSSSLNANKRDMLIQECAMDSQLLATVSESAAALLTNSLIARQQVEAQTGAILDRCTAFIKDAKPNAKPQ